MIFTVSFRDFFSPSCILAPCYSLFSVWLSPVCWNSAFCLFTEQDFSNRLLSFYILSLAGKLKQIWHRIKMKISQCHSNVIFMFCVTCTGKTLMLVVNKHSTIIFLSCHVMQKKKKEILLVNTFSPFSFVPTQLNLSFL